MAEKLEKLDKCTDCTVFDYIRNVIDERNAVIDAYERNLKNQKTMIAEFNHFDIKERIIVTKAATKKTLKIAFLSESTILSISPPCVVKIRIPSVD